MIGVAHLLSTGWLEGKIKVGQRHFVVRVFPGSAFVKRVSVFEASAEWVVRRWVPVVDLQGAQATVDRALAQVGAL